ncbi:MAG: HD domain-containing protein [Bacteriovoracales bacterium]
MGQIIIIEDNSSLLSVLTNGLKRFTNIEAFPREDAEDAISLLKIIPNIDLIIAKNKIGNEDTAKMLANFISENNLSTKLVVNGPMEKLFPPPHIAVENSGDYEQILYYSFKALNIPIEEIKKKIVHEYIPAKSSLFLYLDFIPCDVFLKLKKPKGDDYFLRCYHQGDQDKSDSINGYISQGVSHFFIFEEEEIPLLNVLSDSLVKILETQQLPLKKRLDTMSDAFELFSNLVVKQGMISALTQIYEDLIASAKMVLGMHHFIPTIYEELERSPYSYNFKNFMNLSGAFTTLGNQNFMDISKEVEKLMAVALLHDVRLSNEEGLIFSLTELKSANLSEIQEEIILDHARDAAEILKGEKDFPLDLAKIIREHHGDVSGLGFPETPKDYIGNLSKIFLATERLLKELYESKDTPDMDRVKKGLDENIYHKVIDKLYLIFSGGK